MTNQLLENTSRILSEDAVRTRLDDVEDVVNDYLDETRRLLCHATGERAIRLDAQRTTLEWVKHVIENGEEPE